MAALLSVPTGQTGNEAPSAVLLGKMIAGASAWVSEGADIGGARCRPKKPMPIGRSRCDTLGRRSQLIPEGFDEIKLKLPAIDAKHLLFQYDLDIVVNFHGVGLSEIRQRYKFG